MKRKAKVLTVIFLLNGSRIVSTVLGGAIGVASFYGVFHFCLIFVKIKNIICPLL